MVSIQGLPPLPRCFSRLVDADNGWRDPDRLPALRGRLENVRHEKIVADFGVKREETKKVIRDLTLKDEDSPYRKLNRALTRLRAEMAGLRQLDLTLLCQLWSLSDAIQDYKTTLQDRHLDTNSDCFSIGRTDSMISFDEFSISDDFPQQEHTSTNSLQSSTSSLIQQINELRERAETDFGKLN